MRQLIRFPAFDRVVGGCLLFLLPLRFVVRLFMDSRLIEGDGGP